MPWEFADGGRGAAGFKGLTSDCAVRAISITTGRAYRDVYDDIFELSRARVERRVARGKRTRNPSPRNGVSREVLHAYLDCDFEWTPTMFIGSGCRVHVTPDELPARGTYILNLSKHVTALDAGIIYDTHDPSRDGTRCVYGLWKIA
jgi:hypothetical protein